jgi:hypothetical protein
MKSFLNLAAVMVTLAAFPSLAENRTAMVIGNDDKSVELFSEFAKWENLTIYEKVVGAVFSKELKNFAKTRPTRGSIFPNEYCVIKTKRIFSKQLLALLNNEARNLGIRLTYLNSNVMSGHVKYRDFGDPCFATQRVVNFYDGIGGEHTIETSSAAKFNLCESEQFRVKIIDGIPVITKTFKTFSC